MHTTDFVSAFERFQRMGLTREDLIAPGFLRGLVSQKLIPKICPNCSLTNAANSSSTLHFQHVFGKDMGKVRFRNRSGCSDCNHTGIVDRVIVAEAVEITNDLLPIIKKILFDADPAPFYEYAKRNGILNIHQHAYERVIAGEIDPAMTESEIGRFGPENLMHYWNRGDFQ
jgi:type II secretory ATPase GspE/PulE/Tfp pilus assembly ATPase PilB-like protein